MYNRRRTNNFTYVSSCVKYMIFLLNFIFWVSFSNDATTFASSFGALLIIKICGSESSKSTFSKNKYGVDVDVFKQLFGGLLIGVGLYAFYDKWQATGSIRVENVYDVVLNISLVMVIAGGVVFIVSFAGCVGALRENTCLLKFVSYGDEAEPG